jgi:putative endopeptidase
MKPNPFRPLTLAIGLAVAAGASAATPTSNWIDPAQFDTSIGACDDINQFVNGKWLAANPVPADRTTWGSFEILQEESLKVQHGILESAARAPSQDASTDKSRLGNFYASGMDVESINQAGIDPIQPELAKIDAIEDPAGIAAYLADAHSRGIGQVFWFADEADFKNSRVVIGYALQAGLGLPERGYYLDDKEDYKAIRAAYRKHIARTLELGGAKAADAQRDAEQIMAFETRLAEASLAPVELRDPDNQYHYLSVADAEKVTPHFSWTKFFAAQGLDGVAGFSLSQPKFFGEFDKMLGSVPLGQWKAYLRFHAIDDASPYLADRFADEHFAFYGRTLRGQKEQKPRWKRVLNAIEDNMGMALGEAYVEKTFPPQAKLRAEELVNNLRTALKARIEKLDWMSDATKAKAIEKWDSFMPKIGYPDEWRDWSGLEIGRDSYVGNVLAAANFNHDWHMAKIGKPVDRKEWGMTPQTVNAYYNPLQNEIVFPAAILQAPFFDPNADDALNYGGIGAVIGHEMTHGYDDQGSQFDAQGNYNNWWTAEDSEKFKARTGKLVQQFDDYVAIDDLHVKGQLTLGENIADLGGLNVAFDAMQVALEGKPEEANRKIDGYTENQRFFLNFAHIWRRNFQPEELKVRLNTDPHAPAPFRAIAAPSNMPAFAEAFDCKAGDKMVRDAEHQVKIW